MQGLNQICSSLGQFGKRKARPSNPTFINFLKFQIIYHLKNKQVIQEKKRVDNIISIPCYVFATENEITGEFSANSLKKEKNVFHLASFTSMNSIVEPRSFISTDTAFNCHEGVGRLFMRLIVQLSLFRIIRWGRRFHFDCTCVQKNVNRSLSHEKTTLKRQQASHQSTI